MRFFYLLKPGFLWICLLAIAGCHTSPPEAPQALRRTAPVQFSFPTADGPAVSGESTRGRVTVLAFITMYDLASQVMVRRLGDALRSFRPRANAAAIVLEAPRYSGLVPAYATAMQLPYPIAMTRSGTYQGLGSFSEIGRVPTLVFLDKQGREVHRHTGDLAMPDLLDALRQAGPGK